MKLTAIITNTMMLILVASIHQMSSAQNGTEDFIIPRTNSKAVIHQTIASTQIEITYNRPQKRGRKIFGNLVPFDKIWRTGSDEATEIYFSTPIHLADNPVDSGRYELFTIPGKNKWEVLLQKNKNQWGSYRYNPKNDVMRISVTPEKSNEPIETFTISVDNVGSDYGVLHISWDDIVVPIKLKVDLKRTVIPNLEKALKENARPPYFQSAMFYFENNIDIHRAAELMSLALERNPNHIGMLYRYALILKQKGDLLEAKMASVKSLQGAQDADPELKAEYTRLNTILLQELNAVKN